MRVIDYNGEGFWGVDEILKRYAEYTLRFGIHQRAELTPFTHSTGEVKWIYPLMDRVIEGIEAGDLACAELGVEFIETRERLENKPIKYFTVVGTLALVLAVAGCKSLSVSINDTNPPVFTFSAGQFAECCTHLAFFVVYEVDAGKDVRKAIWEIRPRSGTDNSANGLPQITYGQLPQGFEQVVPSVGTAPALQEGKVYAASGPRIEVPDAFVMFRIQNGKAVRTSESN